MHFQLMYAPHGFKPKIWFDLKKKKQIMGDDAYITINVDSLFYV